MLSAAHLWTTSLFCAVTLAGGLQAAMITGSGAITGTFTNPVPACQAPANDPNTSLVQCSGTGTGTIQWGSGVGTPPGQLSFTGGAFTNVAKGQEFVGGLLYYFNGSTVSGTSISQVDLRMVSTSATEQFNQILIEPILIHGTPNYGVSPEQDADYIYFPNHPELGSFRVFEDASATIEIMVKFGSLDLAGFGDVVADPDHPDSNPANGFYNPGIGAIPEPGTLGLTLAPLALLAALRRRRRS